MTAKEIVRELMKIVGFKQADMLGALAETYGQHLTQQSFSDRLSTKKATSLTTANLNTMLRVLGYKVVVMPVGMKTPNGGYELEDGLKVKEAEGK